MKFIEFSNLHDLQKALPTEQDVINYMERQRWGDNVVSPFDANSKVYKCAGNKYKCKNTGKYFNVKTGSVFAETKIPLSKWLMAVWLISSHKKGISSYQLARDLGIAQKNAWHMLHRLRHAMQARGFWDATLQGTVEADRAFIGGKNENRHESKKTKARPHAVVLGMVERNGKAVMVHLPDQSFRHVAPILNQHVKPGSKLMTDEGGEFAGAAQTYVHQTVVHFMKEYARGEVSTNAVENLWSLVKRGIYGTYHFTSKKHLAAYLNEFAFRYNKRKETEFDRFNQFLWRSNRGNLTWNQLTGKAGK